MKSSLGKKSLSKLSFRKLSFSKLSLSKVRNDSGMALLEFVWIVVALIIPVSYIASACWTIAQQQMAFTAATHAASRAVVLSATQGQAHQRMNAVVATVLQERLGQTPSYSVDLQCQFANCLVPGAFVTVHVSGFVKVWMPLVGAYQVRLATSDTSVVDEFS